MSKQDKNKSDEQKAHESTTQEARDKHEAAANAEGVDMANAAPKPESVVDFARPAVAGGKGARNPTQDELKEHPVEQAKAEARDAAREHLDAVEADNSNLTGTQRQAIADQRREMELEERVPGEPARSVGQSVGTERKEGLRTAKPEPERQKVNEENQEKVDEAEAKDVARRGGPEAVADAEKAAGRQPPTVVVADANAPVRKR